MKCKLCGKNAIYDNLCSQCKFDAWVKLNPKYCKYCGKFMKPTSSDRYKAYSKAEYHIACSAKHIKETRVKVRVSLPLCACGCGREVKTKFRRFYSEICWRKYAKTHNKGYLGGEYNKIKKII